MTNTYDAPGWRLNLPRGWTAQDSEECTTFLGPRQIGALQVSAYQKDSAITDEDLVEFAGDDIANGATSSTAACGDFVGLHLVLEGEPAWDRWLLRSGSRLLYVTYNRPRDADDEMGDVREILASLRTR